MRRRLLGLLLLAVVVAWSAVAFLTYHDAQREIDALLDAHLEQAARLLIAQSGHDIDEIDLDEGEGESRYSTVVAFQVWRRGERLMLRSANAPAERLSRDETGFSDAMLTGTHWRVFSAWDAGHEVLVQVAEDHSARDRIARRIALNALLPLVVALPLLGLVIWWVVGRGMRPLRRLGDELARRGPHDLDGIVARDMPTEVAPLVERLDQLFARIRDSLESERRFTSHAAHELRTPIAAIRAQAEVARSTTDPALRTTALQHVIEACDRAGRLMDQLLLLARADEADVESSRVRCDLLQVAERLLAELAPSAMRDAITLALEARGPIVVNGDTALLEAVLRNLVDNAIRHGGRATDVRVALTADAKGGVVVTVEDSGPGVADADMERLGQRFHRTADARAGGSGLGLSIVARIVMLHHGTVRYTRGARGRGLRVEIRLPAASPPRL
jgi:two-component system sensor histidine kinase QseC